MGGISPSATIDGDPWAAVRVCDANESRLGAVERIVRSCGLRPLTKDALRHGVDTDSTLLAVLVALDATPIPDDPALAIVREQSLRGVAVIAYADDCRHWNIGARCQPLVVGASHLLDSHTPEFSDRLQRRLCALREAWTARFFEVRQVRAMMRRLGIVGESQATLSLVRWIIRVSPLSDLPVVIMGESGTGKELVARALHRLDPKRSAGPFVAINCAAISAGLAESEFFGHRRSAFTGADRDRKGLFRSADGGVLFLDELGDLDLGVQAKLLRVLQEKRLLGLGEDHDVGIDVRVIAASNQDLEQRVRRLAFREDLLHRLNVLPIRIAPLRERPDDLRPLIEHLLARCRAHVPGSSSTVDADFVDALARLELPGNVRQLENLVWGALLHKTDSGPLSISDLPPEVWRQLCGLPEETPETKTLRETELDVIRLLDGSRGNLSRAINECEKLMLQATLTRVRGNQSAAARLLGLTPRSVYNKLRKHQLDQGTDRANWS